MFNPRMRSPFLCAAWAVLFLTVAAVPARPQTTAPVPPTVSAPPLYPDSALFSGIEGDVKYRAHVDADGIVTAVDILSVPATGHGFEDVVRRAVSSWRFTPAMANGIATAGTFEAAVPFTPTLPGEFVLPVSPVGAWAAIEIVAKELRCPPRSATLPSTCLSPARCRIRRAATRRRKTSDCRQV